MQADEFIQFVEKPEFISGIYNYCDRWCEKCNFVNRCTVGTLEQLLQYHQAADEEITKEAFTGMLEMATGTSIDPDAVKTIHLDGEFDEVQAEEDAFNLLNQLTETEPDDAFMHSMREAKQFVENHALNKIAHTYTIECYKWKNEMQTYFRYDESKPIPKIIYCGPEAYLTPDVKINLVKAFEVIDWYAMLIAVKLKRALHTYYTDNASVLPNDFQTDYNGSAKVALIGITQCLDAYLLLQLHLPQVYQSTDNVLQILKSVNVATKQTFPDTDKFVRVGFDNPV